MPQRRGAKEEHPRKRKAKDIDNGYSFLLYERRRGTMPGINMLS